MLVKATHVGSETALSQIVQLVEAAQLARAPVQKLADDISRVFVPIVSVLPHKTCTFHVSSLKVTIFLLSVEFLYTQTKYICVCELKHTMIVEYKKFMH